MRIKLILVAVLSFNAGVASSGDMLTGEWKTQAGETAVIAACGSDYCITAKTGKYAGQQLGSVKPTGADYTGKLTDPRNKAAYSGKLTVSGDSLRLQGCATSVLCKSQTWTRLK